jgi:hypothetical protein
MTLYQSAHPGLALSSAINHAHLKETPLTLAPVTPTKKPTTTTSKHSAVVANLTPPQARRNPSARESADAGSDPETPPNRHRPIIAIWSSCMPKRQKVRPPVPAFSDNVQQKPPSEEFEFYFVNLPPFEEWNGPYADSSMLVKSTTLC